MKNSILFILLSMFVTLMMSCNKNELSYTEKRLIGTWEFEKLKKSETFSFSSENLMDEYQNSTVEFRDDKTAVFNHQGEVFEGPWEITWSGESNTLSATLVENNSGEIYQLIISDLMVTKNKLRGNKNTHRYSEIYRLQRL